MSDSRRDKQILNSLTAWWENNRRDFPWRNCGLSPYEILVAEIMLQKTRAIKVARVWPKFLKKYPDSLALSKADDGAIFEDIYHLGLQKKAKELKDLAKKIVVEHAGEIPENRDVLMSLPGVGDYTACAVRNFSMGKDDPIVDANTRRIVSRVWDVNEREVQYKLKDLICEDVRDRYYMLFDFGALVCKALKPDCEDCPISNFCKYLSRNSAII